MLLKPFKPVSTSDNYVLCHLEATYVPDSLAGNPSDPDFISKLVLEDLAELELSRPVFLVEMDDGFDASREEVDYIFKAFVNKADIETIDESDIICQPL